MNTQKEMILEYLLTGCSITGLEAIKIAGSIRLPARIGELRNDGFNIKDRWKEIKTIHGPKRVKEYFL